MKKLVPSIFKYFGMDGDFEWMIKQPEYQYSLFIFNDNQESFLKKSCEKGGGNAVIRPYQCQNPPRCVGIPTGSLKVGGYKNLEEIVTPSGTKCYEIIDKSLEKVMELIYTGRYKQVIYSSDGKGGIGTGIFKVGRDVKKYIIQGLKEVVKKF